MLYRTTEAFEVPDLNQIKEYSTNALLCCPAKIQKVLKDTQIIVENFASVEVLRELRVSNKNELLGLYKTHSNKRRDLILYRCPLVLYAKAFNESIQNIVARVTVYEISHRTNCVSLRKQWLDKLRKL
jgi:predicted Zn-dependent protease with MMP-like domain